MAIGKANSPDDVDDSVYIEEMNEIIYTIDTEEISELYNFDYNCVYNNIKNDEEAKSQYKYDWLQITSESDNDDLYNIKLYGIFIFLNNNEDAKLIFNLLQKKMPT